MINYIKYKSWYIDCHDKLKIKYGIDLNFICGLIASISPQMNVRRNLDIAEAIYRDYQTDRNKFYKVLKNKTKFYNTYGLFKPHYNNIVKVIFHDFNEPLILNGNKVQNFYLNLSGDYNAVTIDTWMLRYFNHRNLNYLNKTDYIKYSNIIKEEGSKLNLKPAEYQAIIWIKIRIENNESPICFADLIN